MSSLGDMGAVEREFTRERANTRSELITRAQGFITQEPSNMGMGGTATAIASGTLYATTVGLRAGEQVTALTMMMNTAGATLTLAKFALLDAAGGRLAVSADGSASFISGAPKLVTLPMLATYVVPADGVYHASALFVWSGTGPALVRFQGGFDDYGLAGKLRRFSKVAGQTDIQAANTLALGGPAYWFGVS
jgi:hypothetical protein